MPFTETDLQQMSYRELVELAKVNGVYQKKSAKKVALIRRLSSVCASPPEVSGIENVDPNVSKLPPLKEVDETCVSGSDDEGNSRRKTFTKVKASKRKASPLTDKPPTTVTRQNTLTKSDSPDGGGLTEAASSRKSKRLNTEPRNTPAKAPITENPPAVTRQNTFTRSEEPSQSTVDAAEDNTLLTSPKVLIPLGSGTKRTPTSARRNTFTRKRSNTFTLSEEPLQPRDGAGNDPLVSSPKGLMSPNSGAKGATDTPTLKRQNTFTRSSTESQPKEDSNIPVQPIATTPAKNIRNTPKSGRKVSTAKSAEQPGFARAGTFIKTPEKKECDLPNYESPVGKTPPIGKLSVFQRLSSKLPLSERRSLVSSEKRSSLRSKKFLTPQAEKKAHLVAMREGRKNNLSPKSLSKTLRAAITTPVAPVIKQPASTKKSSAKKMPNFAAIHKKNFEKMESLYEHKRRIKERSDFLMSPVRTAHVSRIPKLAKLVSEPGNNKAKVSSLMQMKMATKERLKKAVAQKCSTGLAVQKPSDDGKILKGVRTNKRFELLRQAQKMKPKSQVNR